MKILLIEDDEMIVKGLAYSLRQEGFDLLHRGSVRSAENCMDAENPDLIILDVALPDGDGFDMYQRVVRDRGIPTLFLTARDDEDDIVRGLELGAEDYITKPFSTRELLARIRKAAMRERRNHVLRVKDISFDMDKMTVYRGQEKIELTSLELKILHLLFLNMNRVVRRSDVIDRIWEWTGNDVNDNTVTVYLKRIREKLRSDIVITVKGIGYRIDEDEK